MRRILSLLLASGLGLTAGPACAQVARVAPVAAPVVPAFHGAVIKALDAQLTPLLATQSIPELKSALQASVYATPAAGATPAVFAARAAVIEAVASPAKALPGIVAALEADGGRKALKAAAHLRELGRTIEEAKPSESRSLIKAAAELRARFDGGTAAPGEAVDLSALPTERSDGPSEKKAAKKLKKEVERLNELQEVLAAAKTQAVLVVVQGMDTAGKDGIIKHGMTGLNPAWTKVAAFKKPTPEEAQQDFLERIRKQVPEKGVIGVFNRSHYEDIAVPLVYGTHPAEEVESRYARLVAFERELAEMGVRVVKVFLHASKETQRKRLQRRVDRPDKRWKFSMADLETRKKWDEFQKAYGKILARTSTYWAPWTVIAADSKPVRDHQFARLLRKVLQRMGLEYPEAPPGVEGLRIPR